MKVTENVLEPTGESIFAFTLHEIMEFLCRKELDISLPPRPFPPIQPVTTVSFNLYAYNEFEAVEDPVP